MVNWKSLCLLLSVVAALVESRAVKVHELLSDEEVERVFGTSPTEVPVYDVTHPVQLNDRGDFLSHDVSHSNDDIKAKRNLYLQFSAFDTTYHLSVTLNTDKLLAPDFVTEVRNNGRSHYEKSVDHCHYVGYVITPNGPGAKVAISNCDGLTGVIKEKRGVLMIRPLPNRLGLSKRAHVVYQRSHGDIRNIGQQLGMDVLRDKAALLDENKSLNDESDVTMNDPSNRKYYIESLVVTDTNMVTYHGSVKLLKSYVMSLMNIVQSLIGDGSLVGGDIVYVLNRLMVLETNEPGLTINSHAEKTLSSFCQWAKGQNSPGDSSKAHFDHAALVSRKAFCAKSYDPTSPKCNSLLGLADLRGMCGSDTSCVLSTDTGLGTAFTIAHETGHNLGAEHDGEGNRCPDAVNIMARKASGKPSGFAWSSCSNNYVKQFLSGSGSQCLKDKPGRAVPIPTSLPGQKYTLNDQCKLMVKGSSGFCNEPGRLKTSCAVLWCTKGNSCETNNEPAAEGSTCGTRMWCRRGVCVPYGSEGPKAVDGRYSAWTDWGKCSHTCGGGVQVRSRKCDKPRPKHGGKTCQEKSKEYKYCVTKKCPPSVPDPRMTGCRTKRNMKFAGGMLYDWVYNPKAQVSAKDTCKLMCEAPAAGNQVTFSTFGAVQNGLKCNGKGPQGVCIDGVCQKLGCDNVLGSKAKVDRCGVCEGDGTTCSLNKVDKMFNKVPDNNENSPYYQTIAIIPKGARNIEIQEMTASKNNLALETIKKKAIFNMNYYITSETSQTIKAVGTSFSYKNENGKETLKAQGPLTEAIRVKFLIDDNSWYTSYKVSYKYTTVAGYSPSGDPSQKPAGQYKWITKSRGCSAKCGGGTSIVTAECVRVDDGSPVSHDLCDDARPDAASTECNTHPCPPRWSFGQWSDCSKACNDGSLGQQSREVTCVMTSAGEEELIDDADCKNPKPEAVRSCGQRACPAEWITVNTAPCSATCGRGVTLITVVCQKTDTNGQKTQVPDRECPGDDKPPTSLSCNTDIPCNA